MVLVDPLEEDKSDTPTIHGHPWHGLNHKHDHDHTITITMTLIATALVTTSLTLGLSILCMWVTLALLSEIPGLPQ